jgi:glycosyltransferase involved in cell wall biosynthesis
LKVAIVHDWLVRYRGGEKVLEAICELYPDADLFTLIHRRGSIPPALERRNIRTTFLQHIPGVHRRYRHLLPLFPSAIASFDLRGYELIISSSHCVAKGVHKPDGARHISYVHAPMRYMWDRFDDYFGPGQAPWPTRMAARTVRPWLQRWDRKSARGVDRFVANSHYIAEQIARLYGRPASVVHPPVDLKTFASLPLDGLGQGGYFLWVGAPAAYKRLDVAIQAFASLKLPLWIAGFEVGSRRYSEPLAPNIRLLGQVSDGELAGLYRDARAVIFTAEEDFGIVPLEAQSAGRPVIAFGAGGALETVDDRTGIFYFPQKPDALAAAVKRFDAWERTFLPANARANAVRFSKETFQRQFASEVRALLNR